MADKVASMSRTELNEFIYEIKQFCEARLWELEVRIGDLMHKSADIYALNLSEKQQETKIRQLIDSFYILTLMFEGKSNRANKMNFSASIISNLSIAKTYFGWSIDFYTDTVAFCDEILALSEDAALKTLKEKFSLVAYSLHAHFNAFRRLIDNYIDAYRGMVKSIKKVTKGMFEDKINPKDPEVIEKYISWAMPDLEYFHAKSMFKRFEAENLITDELKIALEFNILSHDQAEYLASSFGMDIREIHGKIVTVSKICADKFQEMLKLKDANQSEDFKSNFRESYAALLRESIAGKQMTDKQLSNYQAYMSGQEVERAIVLFATDYAAVLIHFRTLYEKIESEIKRLKKLLKKYDRLACGVETAGLAVMGGANVTAKSASFEEDDTEELRAAEANASALEQQIRELNLEASRNKASRKQNELQTSEPAAAMIFSSQARSDLRNAVPAIDNPKATIPLSAKKFELLEELLNPITQIAYRYTANQLAGLAEDLGAKVDFRNNKFIIKFPDFKQPVFIGAEASESGDHVLSNLQNGETLSFHNAHRPGHNNGKLIGGAVQTFIKVLQEVGISLDLCTVVLKSERANRPDI